MRWFILAFSCFAILTLLLGAYLSPDDLARCTDNQVDYKKANCQPVDAIVAISGGDTKARTIEAVNLYKKGWAKEIIFSGAALDKKGPSNAAAMRSIAIKNGVKPEHIAVEEHSNTTVENASKTIKILKQTNAKKIILVTSPYHQRRASLEFAAQAGSSIKILNHPTSKDKAWSNIWWLTPNGWWLALGELFRIIIFYLGGLL